MNAPNFFCFFFLFCLYFSAAHFGRFCYLFPSLSLLHSGKVSRRQRRAPNIMMMLDVISMVPNATIGLEVAPATKPDAPKMALAAPAFLRSASRAVAVSPGCISPKLTKS